MADSATSFKIRAIIEGLESVKKLSNSIRDLSNPAKQSGAAIGRLRTRAVQLTQTAGNTRNTFKKQIQIFNELRDNVAITSNSYRILTRDIENAERALARTNVTAKKSKGGFMAGAKAAAPTALGAASASFLPPSAQFGALTGYAAGGLSGAAAGGAIGLSVAGVVGLAQAGKGAAEYAASIGRLEIALKGVAKTSESFAQAQQIIRTVTDELNVPIEVSTKQFTTLSASVLGAGGTIKDAELVFRGVSEAIKATGGDAEDVQSGIRAMSQIFGKGKVSAEELQGQLGERLPGAVVKFANATNRTLPELQKDLRDGTVGLNDVMKFVVKLSEEHRGSALRMAGSTEEAGQRMDVALKDLKRSFGEFFQPIGAGFQNIIADMADMVNAAVTTGQLLDMLNMRGGFNKRRQELVNRARAEADLLAESRKVGPVGRAKIFDERFKDLLMQEINLTKKNKIKPEDLLGTREEWNVTTTNIIGSLKTYGSQIGNVFEEIQKSVQSVFKKMEDSLVEFITKGKLDFKEFARSIIEEITRIFVRTQIMKPVANWFDSLQLFTKAAVPTQGPGAANGGVFSSPQQILVGEGNESELVIPESKMDLAMRRYAKGSRGASILEDDGEIQSESGVLTTAGAIDVRYDVQRINAIDYVTAEQFEQGIRSATEQGAKRGEQMTLRRLQTSSSIRSKVGI